MVTTPRELDSATEEGPGQVESAGPRFQPLSVRGPALIVLGIAVFIVVAGVVGSALDSGNAPTTTLGSIAIPGGTVVPLTPAIRAMKPIVSAGEPPADIVGNLAVPAGSSVTHFVNTDQGQTQFDRTVYFTTSLRADQVVDLYRALLPRLGWRVIYVGAGTGQPGGGRTEVLGKKGSGDGFYWETGAVISPTTSAGTTPFSVELFELPDEN